MGRGSPYQYLHLSRGVTFSELVHPSPGFLVLRDCLDLGPWPASAKEEQVLRVHYLALRQDPLPQVWFPNGPVHFTVIEV